MHYLAPEIRALKDGQKTAPYDKRADIWSLAYTLFDLHHRAKGYKENSDMSLTLFHELALKNLRQRRLPIDGLIGDMFAWEATDRVASSEIAGWKGWPEIGARQQQNISIDSKRRGPSTTASKSL